VPEVKMLIIGNLHLTNILMTKQFLALLEEDEVINKKTKRKKSDGEYHLGLDEVVVVDPVYYSINEKLENPILYQDAEQAKIALKDKLKSNADELSLKLKYLDYHDLEANDTELFNDLSILNRWMNEKISHLGEEVFMHTSTNDEFLACRINIILMILPGWALFHLLKKKNM
jgi:hypothetical protein